MRRYQRLLALPASVLASAAMATSALAMAPEQILQEVHDDGLIPSDVCGFPIAVHAEGTIRETRFFNADGELVRATISLAGLKESWTNTLTGASAWTVHSATQHLTLNDDGSASLAVTGVQGRVRSPQGGFTADIGRMAIYFPAYGSDEVITFAGRDDGQGGPFPELCDALAA